jgi:O-antigen/teichoic acid export membrane protein
MRRLRKTVKSSLAWAAAESLVSIIAAVCTALLVGRIIGPSEFGLAAIVYLFGSLAEVIVSTPFVDPLIQRRRLDPAMLNAGFTGMVAMGAGMYLLILAFAPVLAGLYANPALTGMLAVQGTTCLFLGVRGAPEAMLLRKLRSRSISVRSIVAKIASALVSVLAAVLGMGAWSIILGNVTFAAASTVMLFLLIRRIPRLVFLPLQMAELFSFGLFSLLDALLWSATSKLFSFLVGYFQGIQALGELNLAFRINDTACALISATVSRLALPMLSRVAADRHRLESDFLQGTRLICVIVVPVFLGLALTSREIVALALGPDWRLAASALTAICLFSLVNFVRLLAHPMVKAVAMPRLLILPNLIGLIYVAVGAVVMRNYGFTAELAVWISFGLVFLLCSLHMVSKAIGTGWLTQLTPLAPAAMPALGMCGVIYGIQTMYPALSPLAMLLLTTAFGGSVYGLILLVFERRLLNRMLGRSARTAG